MAPQLEYDEAGTTFYGAVEITPKVEEQKTSRSNTLKLLVGMAFIAVAMTAAVFAFTSPAQTGVTAVVDAALPQCQCVGQCADRPGYDVSGVCEVSADCKSFVGPNSKACTDAEKTALGITGDNKKCAECEHVIGQNQCTGNTCGEHGVCLDRFWKPNNEKTAALGYEINTRRGYECVCDEGWRGVNCEIPIRVCAEWKENTKRMFCDNGRMDVRCSNAKDKDGNLIEDTCKWVYKKDADTRSTCSVVATAPCDENAVCTDLSTPGKYTCSCKKGFDGDGYAADQCTVFYGSVVKEQCKDADGKSTMTKNIRKYDASKGGAVAEKYTAGNTCGSTYLSFIRANSKGWLSRKCTGATGKYLEAGCYDHDDCVVAKGEQLPCNHGGTCKDTARFPGQKKDSLECTCPVKTYEYLWEGKAAGSNTKNKYSPWQGKFKGCNNAVSSCDQLPNVCGPHADCTAKTQSDTSDDPNVKRGFQCTCHRGYEMNKFGECVDIDNCKSKPCGKHGTCKNFEPSKKFPDGHHRCDCTTSPGWKGAAAKGTKMDCAYPYDDCFDCTRDINECKDKDNNGKKMHTCKGATQICVNLNMDKDGKKFECKCKEGFIWKSGKDAGKKGDAAKAHKQKDAKDKCVDYNDCDDLPCGGVTRGECTDTGKQPSKTVKGHTCQCRKGWTSLKSDQDCQVDIDECKTFMSIGHVCHEHASCINTPGSWTCKCDGGYSGDGEIMCEAVDDCVRYDYSKKKAFCKTDMTDCTKVNAADGSYTTDASKCKKGAAAHVGKCVFKTDRRSIRENSWTCTPGPNGDSACVTQEKDQLQRNNDKLQAAFVKKHGKDAGDAPGLKSLLSGGKWKCHTTAKVCVYNIPAVIESVTACTKAAQADADKECTDDANLKKLGFSSGSWSCDKTYAKDMCTQDSTFAIDVFPRGKDYSTETKFIKGASWIMAVPVQAEEVEAPTTLKTCKAHADCKDDLSIATQGAWKCTPRGYCTFEVDCNKDADCEVSAKKTALNKVRDNVATLKALGLDRVKCGAAGKCVLGKKAEVHQCGLYSKKCTDKENCNPFAPFDTFHSTGRCVDKGFNAYDCKCQPGWTDSNCDRDINECHTGTHQCHRDAACVNRVGDYRCECKRGYQDNVAACRDDPLLPGCGRGCHDIDDCTLVTPGRVKCLHATACTDLGIESYKCTCSPGWSDVDCNVDINECGMGTHECVDSATCINTEGSYECKCNLGYTGTGIKADPGAELANPKATGCRHSEDDCATNPCEHGECTDDGYKAYHCKCEVGWMDKNCDANVNECYEKAKYGVECSEHGRCVDTPGSFYCRCVSGMAGDGYTCTDLDDCDPNPCGAAKEGGCGINPVRGANPFTVPLSKVPSGIHRGEQAQGCWDMGANKYKCDCDQGWEGGDCCTNTDECKDNLDTCAKEGVPGTKDFKRIATCKDTVGSYFCECPAEHWDPCECKTKSGAECKPEKSDKGGPLWLAGACTCKNKQTGAKCLPGRTCNKCTQCNDPDATIEAGNTYYCPVGKKNGLAYSRSSQALRNKLRGALIFPFSAQYIQSPPSSTITRGPGFRVAANSPACSHEDRICENINECVRPDACEMPKRKFKDSEYKTQCVDTCGSYECKCAGPVTPDNCWYQPQGQEFSLKGKTSGCMPCTKCQVGEFMVREATSTSNRVCRRLIPDGLYAIESEAGSVKQCLVHWRQANKIYPERYQWGGKSRTQSDVKNKKNKGMAAAELCKNPICGVCPWGGKTPKKNIIEGKEAAWMFRRLEGNSYIILSTGGDGLGQRCLGYASPASPYPQALWWKSRHASTQGGKCGYGVCSRDAKRKCSSNNDCSKRGSVCRLQRCTRSGGVDGSSLCKRYVCHKTEDNTVVAAKAGFSSCYAKGDAACPTGSKCKVGNKCLGGSNAGKFCANDAACPDSDTSKGYCDDVGACKIGGDMTIGNWRDDAKNKSPIPSAMSCAKNPHQVACFCGKSSKASLMGQAPNSAQVVWEVLPLGCEKTKEGGCSKQKSPGMFLIGMKKAGGKVECMYFPDMAARLYSNPRRTPKVLTKRMRMLDVVGEGKSRFVGWQTNNNLCGLGVAPGKSVDDALLANKAAVFKLIRLDEDAISERAI